MSNTMKARRCPACDEGDTSEECICTSEIARLDKMRTDIRNAIGHLLDPLCGFWDYAHPTEHDPTVQLRVDTDLDSIEKVEALGNALLLCARIMRQE